MKNKRSLIASTVLALGVLAGVAAPAQANLLTNGSFEAAVPGLSAGAYCYLPSCGPVPGWTGGAPVIAATSGAWGNPGGLGGYAYGDQLIGLQNTSHMEQVVQLAAGSYHLSWADAGRSGYYATAYDVFFEGTLLNATSFGTTPGQAWTRRSLDFIATGAGELRFQGYYNIDGTAFIDDVVLTARTAQVPEPQSFALVALALLGLGAASRRRRTH